LVMEFELWMLEWEKHKGAAEDEGAKCDIFRFVWLMGYIPKASKFVLEFSKKLKFINFLMET
jgi:hypothetical protein